MDYSFNADIAKDYGVDAAVIIHNLYWWIRKNIANEKHIYDGKAWTYNTIKAFSELFPFFTEKQIRTVLAKLKNEGAVIVGNYNKTPMDRTQWYSLSEKIMDIYKKGKCNLPNGQMGEGASLQKDTLLEEISDKFDEFGTQLGIKIADIDGEKVSCDGDGCSRVFAESSAVFFGGNDANLAEESTSFSQNMAGYTPIFPNGKMQFTKRAKAIYRMGKCNLPNGQMQVPKRANVPNINTNTKQINKPINQSKTKYIINNTNITPLSPLLGIETDGLTSKNINLSNGNAEISDKAKWYVDWLSDKIKEDDFAETVAEVSDRFLALVHEISYKSYIAVNGNQVSREKILESYVGFFCGINCKTLLNAYEIIDTKVAQGIVKNKFNYTVSTLYNAARL